MPRHPLDAEICQSLPDGGDAWTSLGTVDALYEVCQDTSGTQSQKCWPSSSKDRGNGGRSPAAVGATRVRRWPDIGMQSSQLGISAAEK